MFLFDYENILKIDKEDNLCWCINVACLKLHLSFNQMKYFYIEDNRMLNNTLN